MRNDSFTHEPRREDVWYGRYLRVMTVDLIEMAVLAGQSETRIKRRR